MRRVLQSLGLSGLLVTGVLSARAFAQDATDADGEDDSRHNTTQPKEAEQPVPVLTATAPVVAAAAKPKFGDITTSGYLRGSFGASNQKGRMTCFALANPAGMVSKWRLGNECEVWGEYHLTTVVYAGDDGTVASLHFMPTVYIPTTYIGYSPNGAVNSPAQFTTSTGAVLYFPNLYADIKNIPWLFGGTAWAGTRYYKRESIYISDFFYWNPSGVGAGIEDVTLGKIWAEAPDAVKDLALSYGAFAVDGEPASGATPEAPALPAQVDFGLRNDVQLRGLRPWESGELQFGFQYILNYSNNPASHGGWGGTFQYVQKMWGGNNKLALQYGRGGGTGFGTLARFYYPDFSLRHDLSEARYRVVDVLTIQPSRWYGQQVGFVYQHDDNFLGSPGLKTDWVSVGTRVGFGISRHFKVLGEYGYDFVKKNNGSDPQWLSKYTGALAITADREFMSRPELRLFATWALWNEAARTATVDSGRLYTNSTSLNGWIFGAQAETWW